MAKKAREKKARGKMKEIASRYSDVANVDWVATPSQLTMVLFDRFFTGVIDIDLVLRPTIGKRIELIGDLSAGKSVTAHIIEAAAQRTCRHCCLPIIPWVNEKTGEIKEKCFCGKNDPMVVVHIDTEDNYDGWWARQWGVDVEDRVVVKKGYKLRSNRKETYWVATPLEGNSAFDFATDAIKTGAADVVIIDSLALMIPNEDLVGKDGDKGVGDQRVGSRARLVGQGLTHVLNAQLKAKAHIGARPTVLWTNQYYSGPTKMIFENPKKRSSGLKSGYIMDQAMRFLSTKRNKADNLKGIQRSIKHITIKFDVTKSKSAGTAGGQGEYRLYLDDINTKHGPLTVGDTDEPDRLMAYLKDLGLFEQKKNKYLCLGREFKKVKDIREFLSRRDIQYIARYFIFRELLPVSALAYLKEEKYAYSPWGKDIAFELFGEKDEQAEAPDKPDKPGKKKGGRKKAKTANWAYEEPDQEFT